MTLHVKRQVEMSLGSAWLETSQQLEWLSTFTFQVKASYMESLKAWQNEMILFSCVPS